MILWPLLSMLLLSCFLSSCHKNPLKTHSEHKSSRFLINASVAASHSLRLGLSDIGARRAYPNCMERTINNIDCKALYQAMVDFAKKGPFPEFKGVRIADLTDELVYERVREDYEARFFFNNTEY
jgi:hypothetical protein